MLRNISMTFAECKGLARWIQSILRRTGEFRIGMTYL